MVEIFEYVFLVVVVLVGLIGFIRAATSDDDKD